MVNSYYYTLTVLRMYISQVWDARQTETMLKETQEQEEGLLLQPGGN